MSESTSPFRARRTIVTLIALLIAIFIAQLAPRAEAFIYWAEGDAIGRAELDGSGVDRGFIHLDHANALGIALGSGSIFWTHGSACYPGPPDGIGRAAVDGTEVNELFMTVTVGCGGEIAVGPGHLYWIGEGTTIARASLDATTIEPVLIRRGPTDVGCSTSEDCSAVIAGIAVDANYVYWIEGQYPFSDTLARANLDGTGVTTIAMGIGDARELAVDGQHVYWSTGNSIGRANLDGSGAEREFIDAKSPVAVAVDSGHVYWTECCRQGYGSVHRALLDGSNVERDLITKTSTGLAVDALSAGGSAAPGTVKAKRVQRQRGNEIRVKVEVRANETLKAKATGKVKPRYELKPVSKRLDAGERKTLTLKVKSDQVRQKIAEALARGRTATAKLTVKLTDAAGNTSREKLAVKLTR